MLKLSYKNKNRYVEVIVYFLEPPETESTSYIIRLNEFIKNTLQFFIILDIRHYKGRYKLIQELLIYYDMDMIIFSTVREIVTDIVTDFVHYVVP